jgi:hypothetical protein
MRRRVEAAGLMLVVVAALAAGCAGEDSGGDDAVRVTFAPDHVGGYFPQGMSSGLRRITVTLDPLPTDALYVRILDTGGILDVDALDIEANEDGSFYAYYGIATWKDPGGYEGALRLQLCQDPACADDVPLRGASLPYDITITPRVTTAGTATLRVDGVEQDGVGGTHDANGMRLYAVTMPSGASLEIETTFDVVQWSWTTGYQSATVATEPSERRLFRAAISLTDPNASQETTWVRALAADGQLVRVDVTVTASPAR